MSWGTDSLTWKRCRVQLNGALMLAEASGVSQTINLDETHESRIAKGIQFQVLRALPKLSSLSHAASSGGR